MEIRYTTAPVDYDAFGTQTLENNCGADSSRPDRPFRKVSIRAEHLKWHEARYGSGMHASFTEEQFAKLKTENWFIPPSK